MAEGPRPRRGVNHPQPGDAAHGIGPYGLRQEAGPVCRYLSPPRRGAAHLPDERAAPSPAVNRQRPAGRNVSGRVVRLARPNMSDSSFVGTRKGYPSGIAITRVAVASPTACRARRSSWSPFPDRYQREARSAFVPSRGRVPRGIAKERFDKGGPACTSVSVQSS